MDKEGIQAAYEDVRNDSSDTTWAVFKYEGAQIEVDSCGSDYEDFKSKFTDEERVFGFLRVNTGDEMSKRVKFVLIAWCGSDVGALKRAKMSTDKSNMKTVIQSVAIEIQTNEHAELDYDYIQEELNKAGGANYGTGIRE